MKRPTLSDLANKHGTDKGTVCEHLSPKGYTLHYERLFEHRRDEPLRILEIGVWRGASLRMWEEYFPNAEIHGLDRAEACLEFASERSTVWIGDQADQAILKTLAELGPWDLIVDDGGHRFEQQIASFSALIHVLAPRGVYAIEDLHADARSMRWARRLAEVHTGRNGLTCNLYPPSLLILQR